MIKTSRIPDRDEITGFECSIQNTCHRSLIRPHYRARPGIMLPDGFFAFFKGSWFCVFFHQPETVIYKEFSVDRKTAIHTEFSIDRKTAILTEFSVDRKTAILTEFSVDRKTAIHTEKSAWMAAVCQSSERDAGRPALIRLCNNCRPISGVRHSSVGL